MELVLLGFRTQLIRVLKPSLPSLAGFIETLKIQVLAGFAGFAAKTTKPGELSSLVAKTHLTQLSWVY